jgi:sec-independent protein translocase protein TatC
VIVAFVGAYVFNDDILRWLAQPLPEARDGQLVTFGVTEPFFTTVKVVFIAAIALSLPVVLWQLWSFLAPAFEENAQRLVAVFVLIATVLFAGGVAFGYYIVLPRALGFLTTYNDEFFNIQIRASYYYSFVAYTLLAIGLVFILPIFVLALVRLGVLTSDALRRNRRIGIAIVIIGAALLPTVDPVSLVFETIPLLILYEGSIIAVSIVEKNVAKRKAAQTPPEAPSETPPALPPAE